MAESSVSYKCPKCGAPISFQPGRDTVSCEYCGTEFEIAAIEAMFARDQEAARRAAETKEAEFDTAAAGGEWSPEESSAMAMQTCSSCGAELVSDGNTMATECAYCGSPNMMPAKFEGMVKPDFILPFKKTKKEAQEALQSFYKGKYLLPDGFAGANRTKDIQAMYVPFWLFDADVFARANFRAENDVRRETADEIITETSVYQCERAGSMHFARIPVDGSERMDDAYMDSIEPFDYAELVPFSSAYLTGHLADKYDVDAEASIPRADDRMRSTAIDTLQKTVKGYDRCSLTGDPSFLRESAAISYAMMPVWILTTRYEGKPYTFMMNGQTGKFVGSLPIDKRKSWLYPAIALAVFWPVLYFIVQYFMTT